VGSLNAVFLSSSHAIEVFNRALNVIENNVTNAQTPGYVKQDQSLLALPFDPNNGLTGGVAVGPLISARSEYLEQAVRSQTELFGNAEQRATDLALIEPLFDLRSESGVAASINKFFDSFSQLSVNPNNTVSRQAVINSARQLAQSLNTSVGGVNQVSRNIATQIATVTGNINQIAETIAGINQRFLQNSQSAQDPGLDAQVHAALENLSELTNYTVLKGKDGAYNVYIGGQSPLVLRDRVYNISADATSPQTTVYDFQLNDITPLIIRGRLGALIEERNTTVPGYLNDLNTLAQSLADAVNTQLFQGLDQDGNVPIVSMFSYDQPSDAAASLAVTGITPEQIAAASSTAPGGNGNAIAVAQLANAPQINGATFTEFYGNLGARAGNDLATAQQDHTQAQDQVTQAQALRSNQSSVSLNEEATKLLQVQQAYQAAAKIVGVLQTLTQSVLDMVK
jgi:flagellar hook-associated protein 1 FlgK